LPCASGSLSKKLRQSRAFFPCCQEEQTGTAKDTDNNLQGPDCGCFCKL
jgi:hypothetical protein